MRLEQTMIGSPVFTQDGSQIGKVKEIHAQFFKVDASLQPDYWLSMDHVTSGSATDVRLSFTEDRLGDYKLGDPEDYTADGGGMLVDEGSGMGAGIEFDSDRPGAGNETRRPTEAYGQESDLPGPRRVA